ncbi:DUF421 domain-containing protein [Radiobacillus deserti]|uniref:DUF421 domain-containing protein n=1 Tax=Radiobacillus deserti TaxID=2594883 RepID=A0A516KEK6_9BACI|nr:DUF421 domain-containing protein [Radiobacillus deserti]QDP39844.1 DUF421 domain-containing protein [Radiobacillus deserti]
MDFLKDSLLVLGRIATILPLLLFITLFMGKRAIGQLPVFDFLIVVTLGAVVGADIADPKIEHLPTAVAIVGLGILQRIVANWKLKSKRFDKWVTFEPTVIIQDGKMIPENLKRIRYTIDNALEMLREKNIFDINEVELAIVEANGALSVLKKPEKSTATKADVEATNLISAVSFPVIIEGMINQDTLTHFQLEESWLSTQLESNGITQIEDVFLATIDANHSLQVTLKNGVIPAIPPITN